MPELRRLTILQRMTTPETLRATVTITVNGEAREIPAGESLGALLRSLELDPRLIVVEHNRVILRDRDAFDAFTLDAGDVLELVHFVGGG